VRTEDSREKIMQDRTFRLSVSVPMQLSITFRILQYCECISRTEPSRKTPKSIYRSKENDGDTTNQNQNSIIMIQAGTMWRQNIVKAVARVDASVPISSKQQQQQLASSVHHRPALLWTTVVVVFRLRANNETDSGDTVRGL